MNDTDKTYVSLLRQRYQERKVKNPCYSLRAFARDLGVDNGNLIKILDGKLSLSPRTAFKIGKRLQMNDGELLKFILPSLE